MGAVLTTVNGTTNTSIAIAYDYSPYYERIATSLETIATQVTALTTQTTIIATQSVTLASQTTIIATNTTAISNTLSDIEGHQQKVRELAEGTGIRMIGPYDVFGMVSIYRLLIEKAKILETDGTTATLAQKEASLAEVSRLVSLIKTNISREF